MNASARLQAIGHTIERLEVIRCLEPEGEALVRAATDLVDAILAITADVPRDVQVWPPKVRGVISESEPWGRGR